MRKKVPRSAGDVITVGRKVIPLKGNIAKKVTLKRARPTGAIVRTLEGKVAKIKPITKAAFIALEVKVKRYKREKDSLTATLRETEKWAEARIDAHKESLAISQRTIDNLRKGFDIISGTKMAEAERKSLESKGPLIAEYEPDKDETLLALGYRIYEINGHRITVRTLSQMGFA